MNLFTRGIIIRHLHGRRTVWSLLVLAVLYGVRWMLPHPVEETTVEMLRLRLAREYSGGGTTHATNRAELPATVEQQRQVQIEQVSAKGLLWGKYLRVKVDVAGVPPPDGRSVRYFTLDFVGLPTARYSPVEYYAYLW